jgi:NADPH-dependent ferric siderophore reductase
MAERVPKLTTVVAKTWLTPRMARLVLGGEALEGFGAGAFTDHYVKLLLPPAGAPYGPPFDPAAIKAELPRDQWPRMRTFTVRDWDPAARRLTIDFVIHGDSGLAGPWAARAEPGDRLQLLGPGGAYAPAPDVAWHLMVGDPSVLPAIAASLARIPAGVPVFVVVEVDGPEDEIPLETPGDLRLQWVRRGVDALLEEVRALEFPDGPGQHFVHGEASAVRAVRRHLLVERGVPLEALSASGYWKRTRNEEEWRDDKPEWNRLAALDAAEHRPRGPGPVAGVRPDGETRAGLAS